MMLCQGNGLNDSQTLKALSGNLTGKSFWHYSLSMITPNGSHPDYSYLCSDGICHENQVCDQEP